MADNQRIEDLRRRVQKDPASIAFAQLAEECRRAGRFQESVDVCRAGLALHPGYLSARVTVGRALIELNDLDAAFTELTTVLRSAPENLAAIRGVAEIHDRRGELTEALAQYRAALALAKNDPDLQRTVAELARKIEPPPPPASADGLSFEQMQREFLKLAPPPSPVAGGDKDTRAGPPPAAKEREASAGRVPAAIDTRDTDTKGTADAAPADAVPLSVASTESAPPAADAAVSAPAGVPSVSLVDLATAGREASVSSSSEASAEGREAAVSEPPTPQAATELLTIAALEQFLDAIHVARAQRGA